MGVGQSGLRSGLGELPESCVAEILGRLSPPEICQLAEVNKAFYGASLSDFVWETKLPSNYEFLVQKLFHRRVDALSKRDIFAMLSSPIRFDAATKEIWVDRRSGKMCMAISWKGMKITGIDDRRYWNQIPTLESRFNVIAYLKQVWWLEVGGELEFNFPAGTYSLFFKLQIGKSSKSRFGRRVCNTDGVHGWDRKPVRFQVCASNGQHAVSQCYLKEAGNWVCYHAGNFVVENHHLPMKVKFSLTQIDCTHPKGGLCLDSAIFKCQDMARFKFLKCGTVFLDKRVCTQHSQKVLHTPVLHVVVIMRPVFLHKLGEQRIILFQFIKKWITGRYWSRMKVSPSLRARTFVQSITLLRQAPTLCFFSVWHGLDKIVASVPYSNSIHLPQLI